MPAKGWGISEDARCAPLIALVAAPFYHPAHLNGAPVKYLNVVGALPSPDCGDVVQPFVGVT